MTVVRAKLKHLWRKREFPVIALVLSGGSVLAAAVVSRNVQPVLIGRALRCVAGMFAGSLPAEAGVRALTYYLPGYAKVLVRGLFQISWFARLWL